MERALADRDRLNAADGNRRHHSREEPELGAQIVTGTVQAKPPQPDDRPAHRQDADREDEGGKREREDGEPAERWSAAAAERAEHMPDDAAARHVLAKHEVDRRVEQPDFPQEPEGRANDDEPPAVDQPGEQQLARTERQQRPASRRRERRCRRGRRRALRGRDPPDKDALSHLLERRERQDAHPRFWFITGAGLDPHLDDSQQAVQEVLDGIDVLDPSVRNVTLVAKNQPGRDHELARIESIAERERPDNRDRPCTE